VLVELIEPFKETLPEKNAGQLYIQVGAFSDKNNAEALMNRIDSLAVRRKVGSKIMQRSSLYSVLIGPYDSKEDAEKSSSIIASETELNTYIIKD